MKPLVDHPSYGRRKINGSLLADGITDLHITHLAVRDMPGSGIGDELLAWAGIDAQHITTDPRALPGQAMARRTLCRPVPR
jgi:transketolase